MSRLRMTAADVVSITIGSVVGWLLVLGLVEVWLRRGES